MLQGMLRFQAIHRGQTLSSTFRISRREAQSLHESF